MDLRTLEPGGMIDEMELVACRICSKTAIHLGLLMDDDTTQEIFAHVVQVVDDKHEILEACEVKPTG